MKNDKNCIPTYKCGICGSEHPSVQLRMNCEMSCIAKQKEEEKKVAEAKKKAEKESDYAEASAALDNALTLVNKCVEKHGVFKYSGKMKDLDLLNMDFFPSKLWHHFWF